MENIHYLQVLGPNGEPLETQQTTITTFNEVLEDIKNLAKDKSNDAEFGEAVRKYISKYKE